MPFGLTFNDISFTVQDKSAEGGTKDLLSDVCGCVQPGELLCVMGPSGCGKTTLLNVLADRYHLKENKDLGAAGSVLLNGRPRSEFNFRDVMAYVPQEDALIGTLTVRETLRFSADLNLKVSDDEKEKIVEDLLDELGLRVCADTIIGTPFKKGISGGQKRRVSIGVELVTNPPLLFLDEPTSGLDSASAYNVINTLKELASKDNRTIMCTIHQPSSEVFHLFDKVLLLVRGKVVFMGKLEVTGNYFTDLGHELPPKTNPADFYLRLINSDFPGHADIDELVGAWEGSSQRDRVLNACAVKSDKDSGDDDAKQDDEDNERKEQKVGRWKRFLVLSKRNGLNSVRNPGVYWVRIAMYVMLSFMIGTLYLNIGDEADTVSDRLGLLFYTAAFLVFMSVAVLPMFLLDRAVFNRETANGAYDALTYVCSVTLVSIPGLFIIALSSSLLIYPLVGLNNGISGFWFFVCDLFLSLFVAEGLVLLVSALIPYFIIGIAVCAGVYGMFMLTEGFFSRFSNMTPPYQGLFYIGFHSYSFRSFAYNEFHDRTFINPDGSTFSGMEVLRGLEFEEDTRGLDMGILVLMAFLYRLAFWAVLHRRSR